MSLSSPAREISWFIWWFLGLVIGLGAARLIDQSYIDAAAANVEANSRAAFLANERYQKVCEPMLRVLGWSH